MEKITFSTPGILFPAISLLMLAYTNRFLGLASVSRHLLEKYRDSHDQVILSQIRTLRHRIALIRDAQSFGILSLIFCMGSLAFISLINSIAWILFGISIILMILSLLYSFWEIHLSIRALDMEIEDVVGKHK